MDSNQTTSENDILNLLREENKELRIMCALASADGFLYYDDGELQDTRMHPWIDWKHDSIKEIREKLCERNMRELDRETT